MLWSEVECDRFCVIQMPLRNDVVDKLERVQVVEVLRVWSAMSVAVIGISNLKLPRLGVGASGSANDHGSATLSLSPSRRLVRPQAPRQWTQPTGLKQRRADANLHRAQ